jgi:hypothetical protein
MTRRANRTVSNIIINALLDSDTEYLYLDEIADGAGLDKSNVRTVAKFLAEEYGCVKVLPLSKSVCLVDEGLEQYLALGDDGITRPGRRHVARWDWPNERIAPAVDNGELAGKTRVGRVYA